MKWISAILIISGTVKPSAKLANGRVTSTVPVLVTYSNGVTTVKAL